MLDQTKEQLQVYIKLKYKEVLKEKVHMWRGVAHGTCGVT